MKKFLLFVSFAFITFNLYAFQSVSDDNSDPGEENKMTHLPVMIQVTDQDMDSAITELEEQGVIVLHYRGNIILAFIPLDSDDEKSESAAMKIKKVPGVSDMVVSRPRFNQPTMNQARFFNKANLIEIGDGLPSPFDGRGVVVGICDIGFDTRHINFMTKDLEECRIRKVVQYRDLQGERTEFNTPQEIYCWETDNRDDWHGTHVAGIAAGSYGKTENDESGYYSLAPNSDIVLVATQLSDVGILAGVEDIIDYAKSVNKPAVINLSVGNYLGPHDGKSLFTQYLDLCADDAIICISAGNEGKRIDTNKNRTLSYDFYDGTTELRVVAGDWGGTNITGIIEMWGRDDTPFDLTFYWSNNTTFNNRKDVYEALRSENGNIVEWMISLDPEDPNYDETFKCLYNDGYVRCEAGISPLNKRYYAMVEFELQTDIYHGNNGWAEWWPGIKIDGDPGTHVDIYSGGGSFLHKEKNFPNPDNNQCISDLATGFKTISVGMMNNTDIEDGAQPGSGDAKGDINPNSSYGTLIDGRVTPLTIAPGAYIYSSISSAYLEAHTDDIMYVDDSAKEGDKEYYWIGTIGTSMSTPFVAGAIATWLQAYPHLTSEDAIAIIKETNQTSGYPDPENPRHGQGWFNAYAGIQKVLDMTSTKTGTISDAEIAVKVQGRHLLIGNPYGDNLMVYIYGAEGSLKKTLPVKDTLNDVSLEDLGQGLHIIYIESPAGQSKTLKVIF